MNKENDNELIICPHCGEVIPANAAVCPECGSDHETGWAEDIYPSDNILPFEPEKKTEFAIGKKIVKYGSMVIAVLLVYGLIAYFLPFGVFIGIFISGGLLTAFLSVGRFHPLRGSRGRELEKELLAISGHDAERVERLVMYEWRKNPSATRAEMVQAAIDRLKWDRR